MESINCDCVFETWIADGIQANSLIFDKMDLQDVTLEKLETEIRNSSFLMDKQSNITFTKNKESQFVFANFNFKVIEDDFYSIPKINIKK